jgi:hypothetical protein
MVTEYVFADCICCFHDEEPLVATVRLRPEKFKYLL